MDLRLCSLGDRAPAAGAEAVGGPLMEGSVDIRRLQRRVLLRGALHAHGTPHSQAWPWAEDVDSVHGCIFLGCHALRLSNAEMSAEEP